jgi:tetratricopeptide (TPR) repeat protein
LRVNGISPLRAHAEIRTLCDRVKVNLIVSALVSATFVALSCFPVSGQEISKLIEKADKLDLQEEKDAAIQILKQAEQISPNDPRVVIRLSDDYSDNVDLAKDRSQKLSFAKLSLEYAKRAVQLAPEDSDAHSALAVAYGRMTDFVGNRTKIQYSKIIKSEAERSIELNPKNDTALLVLARWNLDMSTLNPILKGIAQLIYGQMPPASQDKALEYFQRAIAAAPQRVLYHAEYAKALDQLGRTQEAKAQWQKARQLNPIDPADREAQAEAARKGT